ncbi:MAG: hypothetical protein R3310_02510 [Candidatus Competibacteraceae bacterium]|nr:hypothetical protein [Candidatus Competibacteraceae bacterium]
MNRIVTAVNIGLILALFIVVIRQPNGLLWGGLLLVLLALALAGWWFIGRHRS